LISSKHALKIQYPLFQCPNHHHSLISFFDTIIQFLLVPALKTYFLPPDRLPHSRAIHSLAAGILHDVWWGCRLLNEKKLQMRSSKHSIATAGGYVVLGILTPRSSQSPPHRSTLFVSSQTS
jgi:hypothetical protein